MTKADSNGQNRCLEHLAHRPLRPLVDALEQLRAARRRRREAEARGQALLRARPAWRLAEVGARRRRLEAEALAPEPRWMY